jgi:hypothetical protein
MATDVVSVLTFKSVETILQNGGTQSWALDRERAARCTYVVICRNSKTRVAQGPEKHGSAFMVGKVSDVVPSTEKQGRWLIRMSEYALVNWPDQWEGRNPVSYWNTDHYNLGMEFEDLDFRPMPFSKVLKPAVAGLSIAEAKEGLAVTFGVPVENVEIMIRG